MAQYLETKPTKKGDKFLIKLVRGTGRIPPPASPTVLPGPVLADALTEVLADFKVSGPAPQLAHERRVRAALRRPKKAANQFVAYGFVSVLPSSYAIEGGRVSSRL